MQMPVISMDFEDFKDLLGAELSKEEFIDIIPQIGADVERIEGNEIYIEFFPDRPDLYSVEGVARALRAYLGHKPGIQEYPVKKSDVKLIVDPSIKDVRPWIVSALVRNVVFTDPFVKSIMDVQEKLHLTLGRKRKKVSIGIHDFDNVKPPFTYSAVDPESIQFIPLGMNDYLDLEEILRKHEKGIDYAWILDGFDRYPIITDVNHEVLSFPPIINGIATTVTENTSNIFLDITGLDLNGCLSALHIIASLLAERGGDIYSVTVEYPDQTMVTPNLEPTEQKLSLDYTNKFLASQFTADQIIELLGKMGFSSKITPNSSGTELDVQIPAYRSDILHPIDLVEDVAIGFGYENFATELPKHLTYGKPRRLESISTRLRLLMVGLSFNEVMTLSLSNPEEQFNKLGLEPESENFVNIKNPRSEDFTLLQISLLPSLLTTLRHNKHRDLPQRIFEIADVVPGSTMTNQRHLAGAVIHAKANFTEVKSIVENLLQTVATNKKLILRSKAHPAFIEGRCVSIVSEAAEHEHELGFFGELHPQTITAFDLGYPVTAFEFDIEKLV
jgi:phenylalanyl-tRNA synthetase beta chain